MFGLSMFGLSKTPLEVLESEQQSLERLHTYWSNEHRRCGYAAMDIDMMEWPMRWAQWQAASNSAYAHKMRTMDKITEIRRKIQDLKARDGLTA